jgi:hypothetical protein
MANCLKETNDKNKVRTQIKDIQAEQAEKSDDLAYIL